VRGRRAGPRRGTGAQAARGAPWAAASPCDCPDPSAWLRRGGADVAGEFMSLGDSEGGGSELRSAAQNHPGWCVLELEESTIQAARVIEHSLRITFRATLLLLFSVRIRNRRCDRALARSHHLRGLSRIRSGTSGTIESTQAGSVLWHSPPYPPPEPRRDRRSHKLDGTTARRRPRDGVRGRRLGGVNPGRFPPSEPAVTGRARGHYGTAEAPWHGSWSPPW
jgi:hypothetical protein